MKVFAAKAGPMVWEEEGPMPILYMVRTDFMVKAFLSAWIWV